MRREKPREEFVDYPVLSGARDSTDYTFTVAEAAEMLDQAVVEQEQARARRVGNGTLSFVQQAHSIALHSGSELKGM